MIQLQGLTKRFGDFTAVSRVTLSVPAGEILALLGPNGAGKTTTVRMLGAILRPTAGDAIVAGRRVTEEPREVRRRVGLLTEHPGLYLRMRGSEYLDFFGRVMQLAPQERSGRARELVDYFGMSEFYNQRLSTYSKGARQKIALVRAMLHDPPVLLLDEPTSAMDPHSAKLVRDAIVGLRSQKRAIIICTHNLAEAEAIADRIAIIRRGEVIALGTSAELKNDLLGPPLMELRLAGPTDGAVSLVSDLVTIEDRGQDWLLYSTPSPADTNPVVLRTLSAKGVGVVTLSEVERSLEDVFLRVVEA
jgi:ABC-2 type transport system ATP-binding protein